jgi:hypothetical protein
MQRSPAENLLTQRSPAGLTCHHSVPLRSSLGNAAPPCEDCCSRRPILRSTFLHSRGSWQRGSVSLTSLGSWQRQPWSRRLSSPQAREGHHDITECEDRSPDFFWAGNRAPFIFFGYVSTKEPVAQLVARVTVSLISVEAIPTTLKGCLETLWPTERSLDLAIFILKLCVECGEPLSSTVEKNATPQKYGSYISSNLQLNRSTRLHCTCPRLNHGYHFLMRVEVLRQMPK